MQGLFRRAAGYQGDALNLPVKNVDESFTSAPQLMR